MDCKYANVCSASPRCNQPCQLYEKAKKRTLFEKIFIPIDYDKILAEFNYKNRQ